MITIYHYDETTGSYIGRGIAPGNPGDPDSPLIPAHSTTTPPPEGRVRYDEEKSAWVSLDTTTPDTLKATVPDALEAAELAKPEPKTEKAEKPEEVEEDKKAAPKRRRRKSRRK